MTAPFGSWPSPLTAAVLVERTVSLSSLTAEGGRLWWCEGRPAEGGRVALVCDGGDVLGPEPVSYTHLTLPTILLV